MMYGMIYTLTAIGMTPGGSTWLLGGKPVSVPLCPSQIPHRLNCVRTSAPWWQAAD